jgi:hypothetical protein
VLHVCGSAPKCSTQPWWCRPEDESMWKKTFDPQETMWCRFEVKVNPQSQDQEGKVYFPFAARTSHIRITLHFALHPQSRHSLHEAHIQRKSSTHHASHRIASPVQTNCLVPRVKESWGSLRPVVWCLSSSHYNKHRQTICSGIYQLFVRDQSVISLVNIIG